MKARPVPLWTTLVISSIFMLCAELNGIQNITSLVHRLGYCGLNLPKLPKIPKIVIPAIIDVNVSRVVTINTSLIEL